MQSNAHTHTSHLPSLHQRLPQVQTDVEVVDLERGEHLHVDVGQRTVIARLYSVNQRDTEVRAVSQHTHTYDNTPARIRARRWRPAVARVDRDRDRCDGTMTPRTRTHGQTQSLNLTSVTSIATGSMANSVRVDGTMPAACSSADDGAAVSAARPVDAAGTAATAATTAGASCAPRCAVGAYDAARAAVAALASLNCVSTESICVACVSVNNEICQHVCKPRSPD
jgi:hypothetical protein